MTQVYLVLTDGFEEIEALATIDILRRGEVDIKMVSITDQLQVEGAHGVVVIADCFFDEVLSDQAEMLIIPGGTPAFNDHAGLKELVKIYHQKGLYIAAICAAPMVLGSADILKGKKATCYPGFEKYLEGAELDQAADVVIDGNIITGRGPGLAISFALEILRLLKGDNVRKIVSDALLLD